MIRHSYRLWFSLACIWLLTEYSFAADKITKQANPDILRAAFIINFARFTTWPDEVNLLPGEHIHFCFFNAHQIHHLIDNSKNKIVNGHHILSQSISIHSTLSDCHLLYISAATPQRQMVNLIEATRNWPILTVSSQSGFAASGGMIELSQVGNNFQFDINLQSAKKSRLVLSSQLLKSAQSIHEGMP